MLDIDHGTYPFVDVFERHFWGAAIEPACRPHRLTGHRHHQGYCTRVGSGPFPTELLDAQEKTAQAWQRIRRRHGTPRRTGWLDLPLLRYAGMINGISWLVGYKLDVLDIWRRFQSAWV